MKPRIVAILQARMGSTRLPGKAMVEVAGMPMLELLLRRLAGAAGVDTVAVAAPEAPRDDVIEELCRRVGNPCFRGSEDDVLDRYHRAALQLGADVVVRLTADNPLTDSTFVGWMVGRFLGLEPRPDYVTLADDGGFPLGLSAEVFTRKALATAWREDRRPEWREHVTPFIYRHPERFRLAFLRHERDLSHLRWTVDTPEDLAFVRRVFDHLGRLDFPWTDALAAVEAHPEWCAVNAGIMQKQVPDA